MKPITHLSLNLLPDNNVNTMLLSLRVVPDGREGNTVYGRTLGFNEADDGVGVVVNNGERFTIRKGRLIVELEHVDSLSKPGRGGYATVTNTIWTWYQMGQNPDRDVYFALTSLAKRVDTAYRLWALMMAAKEKAADSGFGPSGRASIFESLGAAEVAVIALHRAIRLISKLKTWLAIDVPMSVRAIEPAVQALRDSFEHVEERVEGLVRGKQDPAALEIFIQEEFIEHSKLTYGEHSLNVEQEMLKAIGGCREFIMSVARDKLARKTDPRERGAKLGD